MKERRSTIRGFTLVELMVTMLGGMLVSMAVFAIAKQTTQFAMRQSRIADATLQSVVGFERLRADISRAGFLSTPNIVRDPAFCGDRLNATYPNWLQRMGSVFIEPVPSAQLSTEMTVNGIQPRRIVLSGSYAASDEFEVDHAPQGLAPEVVYLNATGVGMVNIGYVDSPTTTTLDQVFAAGRALRLVDKTGREQYLTIASTAITAGQPTIVLANAPALEFKGVGNTCGISDEDPGMIANVVNIVRYDIKDLSSSVLFPQFQPAFAGARPATDATRRELIREELDVHGNPIVNTTELIAEYAVDMGFTLLAEPNNAPNLERIGVADLSNYAGNPTTLVATGPQKIRAVQAWLSVRSREADRTAPLSLTPDVPGPNLLRISMHGTDATQGPFARVRTVQSTISLPNQARHHW